MRARVCREDGKGLGPIAGRLASYRGARLAVGFVAPLRLFFFEGR